LSIVSGKSTGTRLPPTASLSRCHADFDGHAASLGRHRLAVGAAALSPRGTSVRSAAAPVALKKVLLFIVFLLAVSARIRISQCAIRRCSRSKGDAEVVICKIVNFPRILTQVRRYGNGWIACPALQHRPGRLFSFTAHQGVDGPSTHRDCSK